MGVSDVEMAQAWLADDLYAKDMLDVNMTLIERGERYGLFETQASLSQSLKDAFRQHPKWDSLSADKREAIEMCAHKMARIVNGDPEYLDSWLDCIGYMTLVMNNIFYNANMDLG